jgi:hypothetical protein
MCTMITEKVGISGSCKGANVVPPQLIIRSLIG